MSSHSVPGAVLSNGIKGNKGNVVFWQNNKATDFSSPGDQRLRHSQAQGCGNPEGSMTDSVWENWKDSWNWVLRNGQELARHGRGGARPHNLGSS